MALRAPPSCAPMKRFPLPRSVRFVCRFGLAVGALALLAPPLASAEPTPASARLIASTEAGWPQFRGPRRDGVSAERGLLQTWPEGGPTQVWSAKGAGKGFSSTIIADGRLYVTGDFAADLFILAYDLQGKPLWRAQNGSAWLNQYQGARASVTYSAGRLYHENAHGRVVCLDAATGKEIWAVDLLARFQGENITWGMSECLLVDDRAVYATAGGRDASLVALDKRTGEVIWKSEALVPPDGKTAVESPGYVSPILVRFGEQRLIIGCTGRALFCADADTGKFQWTRPRPTPYSVLAMMPVLVGDAVFMAAPLGQPGQLYRLMRPAAAGGGVGVADGWTTRLDTCQGGVVLADGRLYGSFYPRRGAWAALSAESGEVLYETAEFGKGAAVYADGRLYALCEDGWMLLLQPTATQFEVKGRFRLATARDRDAWAHPVILDGRLYLRYHDTIQCHDIRGGTAAGL